MFLEDFGVPVPGETVLIIAAVYAGTGRLNIWLVALIAFLAAILGDNVGFGIGHFGGRPLAERYGKYILLTPERLDKTASFFDRHGGKVIVIARFVEGLRQANGIIAGITGMHWKKFLPFNMLGAALWVALWVSIGYFSGSNIDSIYRAATRYELFFAIAVGLLLLAWIGWRVWKYRKERRAKTRAEDNDATEPGPAPETPRRDEDAPNQSPRPRRPRATRTPPNQSPRQTPPHDEDATEPEPAPETPPHDEDAAEPEPAPETPHDEDATEQSPARARDAPTRRRRTRGRDRDAHATRTTPRAEPHCAAPAPHPPRGAQSSAPQSGTPAQHPTPDGLNGRRA